MDEEQVPRPGSPSADVVDSGDVEALRAEILRLRDEVEGARSRTEILDDRVAELEEQVEELAAGLERYQALTNKPAVRAVIAVTRPFRRFLAGRRTTS